MSQSNPIYLVQHVHSTEEGEEDVKIIGIYSTKEEAENAVRRLQSKPGFSSQPDNFYIDAYVVDADHGTDGFITIPAAQG